MIKNGLVKIWTWILYMIAILAWIAIIKFYFKVKDLRKRVGS